MSRKSTKDLSKSSKKVGISNKTHNIFFFLKGVGRKGEYLEFEPKICEKIINAIRFGSKPTIKLFHEIIRESMPMNKKIPMSNGYFEKFKNRNKIVIPFFQKKSKISENQNENFFHVKIEENQFESQMRKDFDLDSEIDDILQKFINTSY